ncbi:MAG: tRNA lysidine(34) synthetase TilS [Clostridia bacterium]|nr:tRNA lysidine(34) synthetase TilS [Clostridia bacterium]
MKTLEKIKETIEKYELFVPGDHLVVGVSGGPDSMALLKALMAIRKEELETGENPITIHPVHINHHFRQETAMMDQKYVEDFCETNGLDFEVFDIDCKAIAKEQDLSLEEAGRLARYDSFNKLASSLKKQGVPRKKIKIAVAHNKGDQGETVLFRIIRGTGIKGLSAMSYKKELSSGYELIRPILNISRDEIEEYAKELNPRIDESNMDTKYSRNKIRLELLPYLENINPNIEDSLFRLADSAREVDDFLTKSAEKYIKDHENLLISEIKDEHKAIWHKIYQLKLGEIGLTEGVSKNHLYAIDSLIEESERANARIELPDSYLAVKEYDQLYFTKEGGTPILHDFELVYDEESDAYFDLDKLTRESDFTIRHREDGDYFYVEEGKRKKLKDFFMDVKLGKEHRDEIELLARGQEILWILPNSKFKNEKLRTKGRFTAKYKVDNNTSKVLGFKIVEKSQ